MSNENECPWEGCDKSFDTQRGMRVHHVKVHDERIYDTKTCQECGDEFEIRHSSKPNGDQYCSRECHDNSKGHGIKNECTQCGEMYHVKPSEADRSRYCSNECRYDHFRNPKTERVTVTCDECEKEFKVGRWKADVKRYCSNECKYNYQRLDPRSCPQCGRTFRPPESEQKYCCRQCFAESRTNRQDAEVSNRERGEIVNPELIKKLYADKDLNATQTYRRQRAIYGHRDCLETEEMKEMLREMGVYDPHRRHWRMAKEADPNEFLGKSSRSRYKQPLPEGCPSCGHRPIYKTEKGRACDECEWSSREKSLRHGGEADD